MELAGKTRPVLFRFFGTLLLVGGIFVGNHPVELTSRTSLYLMAQYKMAVGDTAGAVRLFSRAAAVNASRPQPPAHEEHCSQAPATNPLSRT